MLIFPALKTFIQLFCRKCVHVKKDFSHWVMQKMYSVIYSEIFLILFPTKYEYNSQYIIFAFNPSLMRTISGLSTHILIYLTFYYDHMIELQYKATTSYSRRSIMITWTDSHRKRVTTPNFTDFVFIKKSYNINYSLELMQKDPLGNKYISIRIWGQLG